MDKQDWTELTKSQQDAAAVLGYNQQKWDGDDDSESSSSSSSSSCACVETRKWNDLSRKEKNAAKYLGYSKSVWDSNDNVSAKQKRWNELSATQREAAETLGYDRLKWDDNDNASPQEATSKENLFSMDSIDSLVTPAGPSSSFPSVSTLQNEFASMFGLGCSNESQDEAVPEEEEKAPDPSEYEDCSWRKLPPHVQTAAKVLGYTKELWDKDGTPESDEKDWDELNPEEQKAAKILGYNRQTWDDDSSSSDSS